MTALEAKKQILASQISLKRRLQNEKLLERDLNRFFLLLKKEVLKALEEYWRDYHMLQGHINLICAPVHEAHREYYEILEKYIKREYKLGQAEAKRAVDRMNKHHRFAFKEIKTMPIAGFIRRDNDLFATSPKAETDLLNRTFRASERTMSRVDGQINQIITDGYRSGKGINDISNNLSKRFDQLATWESRRIARTEVNTSHNVATVDTYRDMGVEYTQWIAANDDRTRDTHAEVDGEIIPMGGKYSNGLSYPGDMSGPIEEWINCRCSNAPFVIPYGYMAPSFSPFRESDLVPIIENPVEPTNEQIDANLDSNQKALYNKYQQSISDAQKVIDSPFSTNNERIQARHLIETTTIKLNQLKYIASGEIGRGYATLIKGAVTGNVTNEQQQTTNVSSPFGDIDKFRLTPQEWERYSELTSKLENEGLKFKEKKEYKKLKLQLELDKWHKKLVTEGKLSGYDAEAYYKKYYNDSYIQEKFNLTPMENTNAIEGKASPEIQKLIEKYGKEDRFELTAEEWKRYNELKPKADELLFMERMEYEDLTEQIRLDELHKKLLKNGKLNETEAKGYAKLYGSITIREKFNTSLIEDTTLIQGKKPTVIHPKNIPDVIEEPEIPYAPKTKTINGKTYTNFTEDTSVIMDKQIRQQKKNGYTQTDIDVVHNWGMEGHLDISAILFNVPELKTGLKSDSEIHQDITNLENAINKGNGLEEPTTLFRGGEVPEGLKPGDEFVIDGFQSYSFDEDVARDFKEENEDRFLIVSHGDTGTKGVHIDDEMFAGLSEDEWLTQRKQRHRVISVDYEKQTLETEFINDW